MEQDLQFNAEKHCQIESFTQQKCLSKIHMKCERIHHQACTIGNVKGNPSSRRKMVPVRSPDLQKMGSEPEM